MRHSDALEAAVHLAFIRYDSRFKRAAAQVLDDQRYASRNGRFQRICFVDRPTMLLLPSRHPKKSGKHKTQHHGGDHRRN